MNEPPNLYDEPNRRANAVFYALHWELAAAHGDEADQERFCQDWARIAHVSWLEFVRWTKGVAKPAADCERHVVVSDIMRQRPQLTNAPKPEYKEMSPQ